MLVLLCMLAFGMMATGIAATVFGVPIIQVERGWTMVIAGSVVSSAGAVLLGTSLVAQRLGQIRREMARMRDHLASIGEMTAERVPVVVAPDGEAGADLPPREPSSPAAALVAPLEASPERIVVGQYSSGGNAYSMFADGSIDAQTPAGLRRFASLEELRAFVAGGGERQG